MPVQSESQAETGRAWYALRVRARSEQQIGNVLTTKEFTCFAPTLGRTRIHGSRIEQIREAAFPGYLFCRFDLSERLRVLNAPGVQYIVGTTKVPQPLEDSVILSLQSTFASDRKVSPTAYLCGGDPVRVVRGPLTGVTGVLIRLHGKDQLVISVDLLQRSVSVEIDADAVIGLRPQSFAGEFATKFDRAARAAVR